MFNRFSWVLAASTGLAGLNGRCYY